MMSLKAIRSTKPLRTVQLMKECRANDVAGISRRNYGGVKWTFQNADLIPSICQFSSRFHLRTSLSTENSRYLRNICSYSSGYFDRNKLSRTCGIGLYSKVSSPMACSSSIKTLGLHQKNWFSAVVETLSSGVEEQPIRILYASQTGTAKAFAYQLSEELSEKYPDRDITIQGWHETSPKNSPESLLQTGDQSGGKNPLHIFLCSVSGVGEPPGNGKAFYDWIMNEAKKDGEVVDLSGLEYAVFGLGSKGAHEAYFNVIGKSIDKRLEELGASRIMEIGLGDDNDCIEDDFDRWMAEISEVLEQRDGLESNEEEIQKDEESVIPTKPMDSERVTADDNVEETTHPATTANDVSDDEYRLHCPGVALASNETRMISKKFPTLKLRPKESDIVRKDLFHLQGTSNQFYNDETKNLTIVGNNILGDDAGESSMHELNVILDEQSEGHSLMEYETGDHLVVYPQNSQSIVEACLDLLDVDRHAIIDDQDQPESYPFPKGLTVYETLRHCIDLGAPPSPSFARAILRKKDIDYKTEIAHPRRTVLDLVCQNDYPISLEDLLFQCTPMKPRYYSISSSSVANPDEIKLTYRVVKYVTKLGMLREGVCSSYLAQKGYFVGNNNNFSHIAAFVNSNPTFRLPKDCNIPVLLIAGGCGVAPIRALLDERIMLARNGKDLGDGKLYLGFRTPDDVVYKDIVVKALDVGALRRARITYSSGSLDGINQKVTCAIKEDSKLIWDLFERGSAIYLCGGARSFGAAIEKLFLDIIQEHGEMDFERAEKYLRNLRQTGKLMDDLAD